MTQDLQDSIHQFNHFQCHFLIYFQVHPRYKQIVGHRLATAGEGGQKISGNSLGMAVAYGDQGYPTQGLITKEVELVGL